MSNSYNSGISFWAPLILVTDANPGLDSIMWIVKVKISATACITIITTAHVLCCDIQAKYLNHESPVLLWIISHILNTSTTNIHVIARFTIQLMGHCSIKKQSPVHHQYLILSSHVVLIESCNNSITLFGLFPRVTTGPGFNSISPEVNNWPWNTILEISFLTLYWITLNNVEINHERQLILEMSFCVSQFLFWKDKHNQLQNTTLNLLHEWFQLVYIYTGCLENADLENADHRPRKEKEKTN